MKKLYSGFAKKNTKSFRPDKETGKWIGRKTKNGQFATIKPAWSSEFTVDGKNYELDVWAFNTKWGVQSLYYELKVEEIEDDGF